MDEEDLWEVDFNVVLLFFLCNGDNLKCFQGLASKLGFQPLTKAVLVAISTSPPKQPPAGPWQLKIA